MATNNTKQEVVRARISKEKKEKFKEIAEIKGKTITEMLCGYIENEIELHEFDIKHRAKIEERIERTDKKLFDLRAKFR